MTVVSATACLIDFTEAIPCETPAECPSGFRCDLEIEQCVEGGGGGDSSNTTADAGTSAGDAGTSDTDDPGSDTSVTTDTSVTMDSGGGNDGGGQDTGGGGPCPTNMAPVTDAPAVGLYCIDRYEASRPDATESFEGVDTSMATSRPGVLPWASVTPAQAEAACVAAGKRLCNQQEWIVGCGGSGVQSYPYSQNMYVQGICNASGQVQATGFFPDCLFMGYMTYDMSGNLSEIIASEGSSIMTMGGSYTDTAALNLSCTQDPRTLSPSGRVGFRCCVDMP
ncbi:MAG: hypothetical protein CMH57_12700 [Myxococcales bacterium]|nr:hypothetical protein [Myxococcales bacterium]